MAAHPIVVDPEDPVVRRLRGIAARYPEFVESTAWGRPAFKAGSRMFLLVGTMDRPHSFVFKPEPDARRALEQDERFFVPKYWGAKGWLAVDTDDERIGWDEVAELIDGSYRQGALARQLTALAAIDADGAAARR